MMADWQERSHANKRQVQSLLGIVNFVASVSPPGRFFSNGMLHFLRAMPDTGLVELSREFREDLKFFINIWPGFNGVSIIDKQPLQPHEYVELDACLKGCGAICGTQVYMTEFPPRHISHGTAHCLPRDPKHRGGSAGLGGRLEGPNNTGLL